MQYGNGRLTAMAISAIPFTMMTSRPKNVKPAISWPSLGLTGCTCTHVSSVLSTAGNLQATQSAVLSQDLQTPVGIC